MNLEFEIDEFGRIFGINDDKKEEELFNVLMGGCACVNIYCS